MFLLIDRYIEQVYASELMRNSNIIFSDHMKYLIP